MNKYELLKKIAEISKLPVVILTADNSNIASLGHLFERVAHYLMKPVTMREVGNLWQVLSVKSLEMKEVYDETNSFNEKHLVETRSFFLSESRACLTIADKSAQKAKRRYLQEIDGNSEEVTYDPTVMKKPKIIWTDELHSRFFQVVSILGIDIFECPRANGRKYFKPFTGVRLCLRMGVEVLPESIMDELLDSQGGHFESMEPESLEFGTHFLVAPLPSATKILFPAELISNDMPDCGFELLQPQSDQLHYFLHTIHGQFDGFSQMTTQRQQPQQQEQQEPYVERPLWRPLQTEEEREGHVYTEAQPHELFDTVKSCSLLLNEEQEDLWSIDATDEAANDKGSGVA